MVTQLITGLIPKIEGFQPIPNAVMIPFMEAQSAALAYGFGLNYEYGKRKIRSMSNEQFNSLTSEQITNMSNEHTHIILSQFQAQVPRVMPMQAEIFRQYVTIEKDKVKQNFELAKWMVQYIKENIDDATAHLLGGHLHGETLEQPFVTPPDKFINPKTGEQGAKASTTPKNITVNLTEELPISTKTFVPPPPPTNLQQEHIAWLAKKNKLLSDFVAVKTVRQQIKRNLASYKGNPLRVAKESMVRNTSTLRDLASKIRQMSNDYRHPNAKIGRDAITLRQQIANGLIDYL